MNKSFTVVNHYARNLMGLDLNEYAVIDYVFKIQSASDDGFCADSTRDIENAIGIGKSIINRAIKKAISNGFICTDGNRKQVTDKWAAYVEY
jgi:DNA-binding MarR family transcriptional regulator